MKEVVNVIDGKVVSVLDPSQESGDFLVRKRARDRQYAFDYAFDASAGQQQVSCALRCELSRQQTPSSTGL